METSFWTKKKDLVIQLKLAVILASEILADNLGKNVTVYNRGISGNRIADLYARWIEDCLNLNPTILSILVGINEMIFQYDHNCGASPERFKKTYKLLIEEK